MTLTMKTKRVVNHEEEVQIAINNNKDPFEVDTPALVTSMQLF